MNGAPWRTIPKPVSCLKKSKKSVAGRREKQGMVKKCGRRGSQGCVGPGPHLAGTHPTFERRAE